jgi:hypothetical protein
VFSVGTNASVGPASAYREGGGEAAGASNLMLGCSERVLFRGPVATRRGLTPELAGGGC